MRTTFVEELTLLHAQAGDPADLLLVQNAVLRKALEDLFKICSASDSKLATLTAMLERRTAALSPAQDFSTSSYHEMRETGTYEATGDDGSTDRRAFVNNSPQSPDDMRVPTQVDLVLPPTEAFFKPGGPRGVVPPLFGQKSARWPDVFALVQQPKLCWEVWGPKSIDRYRDVNEICTSWIDGDAVFNAAGTQKGKKPPLKFVEQYLHNRWRTSDDQKARTNNAQHWSRYREIPEWIEREANRRGVAPSIIVTELEGMRVVNDVMNWLRKEIEVLRKAAAKTASNQVDAATPSSASSPDPEPTTLGQPFEEDTSKRKRAAPAIEAVLRKAGVLRPGRAGQKLILEKLFYQLGNFSLASLTLVAVLDGPGRPSEKRGIKVIPRSMWFTEPVKKMFTAFGYNFYEAPGEAEAQLAWLNQQGFIDGILTEDSDAFIFGARCVIRGPKVEDSALVYYIDSIENTASVALDQPGLFLCALLLGGDYAAGIAGIGPATAWALARHGFGQKLVDIMNSYVGNERLVHLAVWRTALCSELRTNSSVSRSLIYTYTRSSAHLWDTLPDWSSWRPRDPAMPLIAEFCSSMFGWHGDSLLKKLNSNVFPGVTFRMISSPLVLYDKVNRIFASPGIGGSVETIRDASPSYASNPDLAPLELKRLAGLPPLSNTNLKLVSVPQVILAVAMRDTAMEETDLAEIPGGVSAYDEAIESDGFRGRRLGNGALKPG
ncbi:hypothetical protein R3P38DRAFT_3197327 [Favolaschia claudopus]|uniref:XPG-I domain-containing protein n=1 Tax=Favolaschia claudopus TaxID=2862362 RepID=A0AAW0B476_9AGAR